MQVAITFDPTNKNSIIAAEDALKKFAKVSTSKKGTTIDEEDEETSDIDVSSLKKTATKKKPGKTVSDDEDESFGKKPLRAKDLEESDEDADEEEIDEDSEDDQDDSESDEEDSQLSFEEVRAAVNKYGEKHPDQMRAILSGYNLKGPKELKLNKKYWEPVYRKVMAKIKAMPKATKGKK